MLENIVIFVPLGIYLKMLRIDMKKTIIYGAGLSLMLEMLQFVIGIGASDITDVITNTLGTIIGIRIYCILLFIIKKREILDKILRFLAFGCTISFLALIAFILSANSV